MTETSCVCPEKETETLNEIVERAADCFRRGQLRTVRFPAIRDHLGIDLLSTFSHLTPNLPVDEVWGNVVLLRLAKVLALDRKRVLNVAYDNYIPRSDTPKAFTLQFGIVSLKCLDPYVIPSLQERFVYEREKFFSDDGQNRMKSAPEENLEAFRQRFDELDAVYSRHAGEGDVVERLLGTRRDLLGLLGRDFLPESGYSQHVQSCTATILEMLEDEGYPFWEMPIPESARHYVEDTFLVEGIDEHKRRVPVRFEGGEFHYDYSASETRSLSSQELYEAMRRHEVIPTMPLVILTLVTAPQMPHLGGRVWQTYAPAHVDLQAEWLGIDERSDTLILSTGGQKVLSVYRQNQEFIGYPLIYLTYGPELILRAIEQGRHYRVEFKRQVLV